MLIGMGGLVDGPVDSLALRATVVTALKATPLARPLPLLVTRGICTGLEDRGDVRNEAARGGHC